MIRAEDMDVQVEREGEAPGAEGAAVGTIAVAGCWDLSEEIDADPDCGASATFGDVRGFLDFFDRIRPGDFPRLSALMREVHRPGDRVAVLDRFRIPPAHRVDGRARELWLALVAALRAERVTMLYTLYGPDEGEDPRALRIFMQMRGFLPTGESDSGHPILRCDLAEKAGAIGPAEAARFDRIARAVMEIDEYDVEEAERAAGGLRWLGAGGHRVVFAVDEKRVLKVATDWGRLEPGDVGQNTAEADRWRGAPAELRADLAPVLARARDDAWLLMARTRPVDSLTAAQRRRFERITYDVAPANAGRLDGRLVLHDYAKGAEAPAVVARSRTLFIGLRPSAADRKRLAACATEDADDLHVTMTFHGKISKLPSDAHARALRAVQEVARGHGPVSARVLRSARFDGPEQDVVYASLRAPGVVKLRAALASALAAEGLPADATHAYVPHLTLGKVRHGAPWPMPEPPSGDLVFGSIYLWVGRVFRSVPLRVRP